MMRNDWLIFTGILIFLVANGFVSEGKAQSISQETVTLNGLLKQALEHNRDLKAAEEEFQASRHRVPQASALPEPTVGYAIMGPDIETRVGPQEEIYEFEQMIPFPGKLMVRRDLARAESKAAQAKRQAVEREVILKVSQVYYDLYSVDATLAVLEGVHELLKKFENIAQARYASQQAGQSEVAIAQTEISQTLQNIFQRRQERQTLAAMINALLNANPPAAFEKIAEPVLTPLNFSLEDLLQKAREHRPELLEATAMRQREEQANVLAKYEYAPDIAVGFQYTKIGSGMTTDPDDGTDAWMVPLKVTIPLWQNRIIPAIQEARRNLNAAQAKLEQSENMTEYEIRSAYYQFTTAKQIVELYQNALLPQAELAFRSEQAGYEAGRTDILKFLNTERTFLNAQMAYYQALADALKSFAALERAVGMNLGSEGGH